MRKHVLFLLFIILFLSCSKEADDIITGPGAGQFAYLALGDSYTIGEDVPDSLSFPKQLEKQLQNEGFQPSVATRIIAQTGWTTDNLSRSLAAAQLQPGSFTLATILAGVNDQYWRIPIQLYPERFLSIVSQAKQITGGYDKLIILSIPDYSVTPFAKGSNTARISMEIDAYNLINRSIADSLGIAYIDVTDISRKAATDLSYLASDRLHPSQKMYAEWVKRLLPVAVDKIRK
jgi:lysophospholipase L1-like esterase